jgi:hypothetical protein
VLLNLTKQRSDLSNLWRDKNEQARLFVHGVIDQYRYRYDRVETFEGLNLIDPQLAHCHMWLEDRVSLAFPPSLELQVPRR